MEQLGLNEVRERFLRFFEGKEHLVLPSFSLVPKSDKSLLLINAGMAPLKPYFTGQEVPPKKRVTTCQKCIRTPDIERVGITARHGTFFEMLGNFSFGDYFKEEAISWAWEFITEDLKLPVEKLWVTIYQDDDEAFDIWHDKIGVPAERIVRMGKEDNFWEIGVGPCGPCSEIYFDRGPDKGCGKEDCAIGCDCDRFVEFWNLVFTQFNKDEEGNYTRLSHPNIDTGMGLERIAAIMQGVDSLFEVDTIRKIMEGVSDIARVQYGQDEKTDISLRVITDHIRGTTFMISDGILPSNEGRGYVLRRLLRRAARHGKLLGIDRPFLSQIADIAIRESHKAYPELKEKKDYILKVIEMEEERFDQTIDQGLSILQTFIEDMDKNNIHQLDGERAFRLYDTYGFPLDLTKEILAEHNMDVDESSFKKEMEIQRERARSARHETNYMGTEDNLYDVIDTDISTAFKGYDVLETKSKVINIIKDNELCEKAEKDDNVILLLDKTPFYGESGGQVGDKGIIKGDNGKIVVEDTQKIYGNRIIHKGKVVEGTISTCEEVTAKVDKNLRMAATRNHTCTHLLHKALREVLGNHVEQSGSFVAPDKLRFDFSHFAPLSDEELAKVEKIVNEKILESMDVETIETSFDDAKHMGATALFGEKYGDIVRVVKIDDFSIELCGGTHLKNTAQAGVFKILGESGVAAGIRRIEAITGMNAYMHMVRLDDILKEMTVELKTSTQDLPKRIDMLIGQIKDKQREIDMLRSKLAINSLDDILKHKKEVNGISYIAVKLDEQDMDGLRKMADVLRDKLGSGIVVLASTQGSKVFFVAAATKDVVKQGIHAGNLIREVAKVTGGGGGGRPDMAQAGGKDPSKVDKALEYVEKILATQLA